MSSLALLIAGLGRLDEAVALMKRAIEIDPLSSGLRLNLANYLIALDRYDEAEAALRKAIELQPRGINNYCQLATVQILRGKTRTAVELAKKETDPLLRTYALAVAHFADGARAEADAALKELSDGDAEDAGSQIATVYALRQRAGQNVRVAGARLDDARRWCE